MKDQKAQLPVADSLPSEQRLRTPGHCLRLAQGCCRNALLVPPWASGKDLPSQPSSLETAANGTNHIPGTPTATWWLSRETRHLWNMAGEGIKLSVTGLLPGGMEETKPLGNTESKIHLLSREG